MSTEDPFKTEKVESPIALELVNQKITGSKAAMIEQAFAPMVTMLHVFEQEYEVIMKQAINDETIKDARALRLKMVKIRTGTAAIHKEQKEEYLRTGRAIDAVKNVLEWAVTDKEKALEKIENHFINIQKEEKKRLFETRIAVLEPLIGSEAMLIPVADMGEEAFNNLVSGYTLAKEAKEKAEKEAQAKRISDQAAKELEEKRLREENEKLKAFNYRINQLASIGFKWREDLEGYHSDELRIHIEKQNVQSYNNDQFDYMIEDLTFKKKTFDLKQQKIKEKADEKARNERLEKKRLEEELQTRKDEEEAENKRIAAEKRKAKRAPDRVKLVSLSNQIELLNCADLKDEDSIKILNNVTDMLAKVVKYIRDNAANL